MEFKTSQQILRIPQEMKPETAEHGIESELILPESYGDIGRILKCKAQPTIVSTTLQETSSTVEGTVHIQLLYVNTQGEVCCYTQAMPFYHEIPLPQGTQFTHAHAKTDYCNCRAVSTRKVEIRGAITIKVTPEGITDLPFITGAVGGGVQLDTQPCQLTQTIGIAENTVTLTDEIQVDSQSIHTLLRCKGIVKEHQYKCIGGKVLVNGILEIQCLYKDIHGGYCPLQAKLPFSQVLDAQGIDDTCLCTLQFTVTNLELRPRTGLDGECRTLLANATIVTTAQGMKNLTLPLVTDGFSTQWGFSMETYQGTLKHLLEVVQETNVYKKQLDTGRDIGTVLDIWCEPAAPRVEYKESTITLSGIVTVCALLTDADQSPFYIEKTVDYTWEYEAKELAKNLWCLPEVTATDLSYTLGSNTTLDLRLHLQLQAPIYQLLTLHPATNIQVNSSIEAACCPAPLVVYFAKEKEPIFQIARKYSTTCKAILEANNLTEPYAPGGALLVPACKE